MDLGGERLEARRAPSSPRLALAATIVAAAAGCGAAPPPCAPLEGPAPPAATPAAAPAPAPPPADVAVRIEGLVEAGDDGADPRGVARIRVTLRAGAAAELRALAMAGPHEQVRSVTARDARGSVPATVASAPGGTRVELARDPSPPLEVTVDILAPPARPSTSPALRVDDDHARVPFEWIPLPRALDARAVDLEVELGGLAGREVPAASTLGLGRRFRGTRELGALRRGFALFGELGSARFDAYEGDDSAIWLGFTSFDPRWVAAESAATRSALARWVGAKGAGPLHTIVLVSDKRPDVPFAMAPRDDGLWISADLTTAWDAGARLAVAEHFASRYFGGALSVGERGDPLAAFWGEGVARVAGTAVLFELGAIGFDDLAAELNRAIAEVLLARGGDRPLAELASEARAGGDGAAEARRVLVARGVLWASGLDARRRSAGRGPGSLGEVARGLFRRAAEARRSTWSTAELAEAIVAVTGEPAERDLVEGDGASAADRALPRRAAGSCHEKKTGRIARFAFGASWDVAPPSAEPDAPLGAVREVEPGSPAERAGLRAGDVLVSASYAQGRPDVEAKLVVRRAGKDQPIRFFPRVGEVEGPVFARRRGARDEACSR